MGSILGVFAGFFVQLVANVGLRALALKFFIRGLIVVAIPICVLVAMNYFVTSVVQYLVTQVTAATASVPGTISGASLGVIGAYLYATLGLNTAVSFIISMALVRFSIRAIPFLHL